MENGYCVYKHTCKINGKIYIGMTNNVKRRWRCRGIEYKPHEGREHSRPFWNAIQKHGWDNFTHEILESGLTMEEACEREKYYIDNLHSRDKDKGYNIAEGGNGGRIYTEHPRGMLGKHHSEEKKAQQSELMRQLNSDGKMTWKHGHPRGMLGKHHSEEFKERLRNIPPDEHPSAKPIAIEYPDGTVNTYPCKKYLLEDLKITTTVVDKMLKSHEPYRLSTHCHSNRENLKKIEGSLIYFIEDTEITHESKELCAS